MQDKILNLLNVRELALASGVCAPWRARYCGQMDLLQDFLAGSVPRPIPIDNSLAGALGLYNGYKVLRSMRSLAGAWDAMCLNLSNPHTKRFEFGGISVAFLKPPLSDVVQVVGQVSETADPSCPGVAKASFHVHIEVQGSLGSIAYIDFLCAAKRGRDGQVRVTPCVAVYMGRCKLQLRLWFVCLTLFVVKRLRASLSMLAQRLAPPGEVPALPSRGEALIYEKGKHAAPDCDADFYINSFPALGWVLLQRSLKEQDFDLRV